MLHTDQIFVTSFIVIFPCHALWYQQQSEQTEGFKSLPQNASLLKWFWSGYPDHYDICGESHVAEVGPNRLKSMGTCAEQTYRKNEPNVPYPLAWFGFWILYVTWKIMESHPTKFDPNRRNTYWESYRCLAYWTQTRGEHLVGVYVKQKEWPLCASSPGRILILCTYITHRVMGNHSTKFDPDRSNSVGAYAEQRKYR